MQSQTLWRRLARAITERALILVTFGFVLGFVAACASGSTGSSSPTAAPKPVAAGNSIPTTDDERLTERAINIASPSVVKVTNVGIGLGSGVILTADGYIVTNKHVVANEHKLTVTLANGKTFDATLRGTDSLDDLAVVKINASGLPTATLANSGSLTVGQTVLAIGNPLGITRTVTDGIISALNRTVTEGQGSGRIYNAVQTSAPINPGNSGGALIDLGGRVVGVPTLTAVDPEFNAPANGIGFAIPSNTVNTITQQIIKHGKVLHTGRAALGIGAVDVTAALAQQYGLPVTHGVLVASELKGGPAQKAGIKRGDVIVAIDGKQVGGESALLDILAGKRPGQKATVTVVTANGKHKTVTLRLGELSANATG